MGIAAPLARGWAVAASAAALVIALAATALALLGRPLPGGGTPGHPVGTALDGRAGAGGTAAYAHAEVGEEYWVALPPADNVSDEPVTLLAGEFTDVPRGLRLVEYRALSHRDTDGHPLGVSPVGHGTGLPDPIPLRAHSARPSPIAPHREGEVFWAARFQVVGRITGDLSGCRYRYRHGGVEYEQTLSCTTRIRLGPRAG
ncbi:hypothetical protein [Streptomyces lichenis]|uniref:Uncharacterized protein n=1 Tax=Streptomyces lichenis TaxID=2306967 RepID=A0ABT0IFY1_9ACTN|nr:hypothetical protein [Streptomyces lichenis]MCK8680175.1 hypothetical protein [Streptomyces lichenis]